MGTEKINRPYSSYLEIIPVKLVQYTLTPFFYVNDFNYSYFGFSDQRVYRFHKG